MAMTAVTMEQSEVKLLFVIYCSKSLKEKWN